VTSATIDVTVNGDPDDESDERFLATLADPTNADLGDDIGIATITDDDGGSQTALTLRVMKRSKRVAAKGVLEPAEAGLPIRVTLLVRRDGRYRKAAAKDVTMMGLGDRDGDGIADASYKAIFTRPAHGRYMFRARFSGTADLEGCLKTLRFRL
jgi:hypothetical protein